MLVLQESSKVSTSVAWASDAIIQERINADVARSFEELKYWDERSGGIISMSGNLHRVMKLHTCVRDAKTGEIVSLKEYPFKSYLKGYVTMKGAVLSYRYGGSSVATMTCLNTANASKTFPQLTPAGDQGKAWAIQNIAADSTYGITFGTDGTANTSTQYKINTPVVHSAAMTYGAMSIGGISNPSGQIWQYAWQRVITNVSAGSTNALEVGCYSQGFDSAGTAQIVAMTRDVVNDTFTTGQTYTIAYTEAITVV